MFAVLVRGVVAATLSAMLACGGDGLPDDPSLPTLRRIDVVGMQAGNAIGTTVSGPYLAIGVYEACHCRLGSCGLFRSGEGEAVTMEQQDGVLSMRVLQGFEYTGGINQDGEFWLGGAGEDIGLVQNSQVRGRFMLAEGEPVGFSATLETTIIGHRSSTNSNLDCDTRASMTADFELR
jgi:hypothetical protein